MISASQTIYAAAYEGNGYHIMLAQQVYHAAQAVYHIAQVIYHLMLICLTQQGTPCLPPRGRGTALAVEGVS